MTNESIDVQVARICRQIVRTESSDSAHDRITSWVRVMEQHSKTMDALACRVLKLEKLATDQHALIEELLNR